MGEEEKGNILLYQTEDGETKVEVALYNDTVWLRLDQMAVLFQRDKSTISRHIKNVFDSGELQSNSVVAYFATTASDEKTYQVAYYKKRVSFQLSPVEIHFIENFERERKRLKK